MRTDIKIIISAVDKGVKKATRAMNDGFKNSAKSIKVFNQATRGSQKALSGLAGQIKGLVAAWAGFQGISGTIGILQDADQALFNMQSSVKAASREFKNTGGIDYWESAVKRLSDQMVIYSDTSLRNAISRTVDMTKRLGLTKEQMEEVIKRSADLGAGKVDLEGAIERVTAALRGEAESAEYLGLTLNENYVKSWAAANKVTKTAWKDLSDVQKAQIRYMAFLAQSNEFQGRAAASAKTFGGAVKLVRKEIENAIIKNKNVTQSLADLGQVLRENAGEIGAFVGKLVELGARVIEFAAKYQKLLLTIGGTVLAMAAISRLINVIKGLNAAFAVLTGSSVLAFFSQSLPLAMGTAAGAFVTLAAAAGSFFAGWKLGKIINDMNIFEGLSATVGDAVQYTFANIDKFFTQLRIKWLQLKKIIEEVNTLGRGDTSGIEKEIEAERRHIEVIELTKQKLEQKSATQEKVKTATEQTAAAAANVKPIDNIVTPAAINTLDQAKKMVEGLDRQDAKVDVDADTRPFREEIKKIDGVYTTVKVPVDGDTKPIREKIVRLADGTYKNIKIPVDGDTTPARQKINELKKAAAGTEVKTRITVDTGPAQVAINNIRRMLKSIPDETVYINVIRRSRNRLGGIIKALATGGRLPGYGGGDRISALLEAGEFVIRKEAVKKYGSALFTALNHMAIKPLDLASLVSGNKFAAGGLVPSESMTISFRAGGAEMPLTVAGTPSVTRQMVKEFETELRKMGLSHA